jgi:hypothetical protein
MSYDTDVRICIVFPTQQMQRDFLIASMMELQDDDNFDRGEVKAHWSVIQLATEYTLLNAEANRIERIPCSPDSGLWGVTMSFTAVRWDSEYEDVRWYTELSARLTDRKIPHAGIIVTAGERADDVGVDVQGWWPTDDKTLHTWGLMAQQELEERFGVERVMKADVEVSETIEDFLKEGEQS